MVNIQEEASGSFLDPLTSLDWSDCPAKLPFFSFNCDIQSVYVPDSRGGRVYLAMTKERKFCFCTFGNGSVVWHSELDLPSIHGHPFHDYALTVYRSKMVLIGGTLMGFLISSVWTLNSKTNKWENLPPMLTSRSSVVAVGYGDHLVAAGGKCGDTICCDVEVFNGSDWKKVKQLPDDLKQLKGLTSVLHTDKRWYIMEADSSDREKEFRATYSAPIEEVISDSPTCVWKKHSKESSPPSGKLPPVSFNGQLIVVGNNDSYGKAKLYFHSPVTDSWVSIENVPYVGDYCNVVGIASLSHSKALMLIYNGSKEYTVKMVSQKGTSK